MSREAYDELLRRLPEAVLSYIDEEDGEIVLVSDSIFILAQSRKTANIYHGY